MLHRLSLRVLPQLERLVTDPSVRKRKRLVMLAPGFVAFLIYRLIKALYPLDEPLVLLALSGVLAAITAAWAYRMGRQTSFRSLWKEDGPKRVGWLVGWVGFVYGVQLALLVLALLKLFVGYDFLLHPDGPGMMAIIIACTSVTRDAFEIGHVRFLEQQGLSVQTFPDGMAFRRLVTIDPVVVGRWVGLAGMAGIGMAGLFMMAPGIPGDFEFVYVLLVSGIAAWVGNVAFWSGGQPARVWWKPKKPVNGWPLVRFWLWPCLTFSLTYYLVQAGIVSFVFLTDVSHPLIRGAVAGLTMALMAAYGYYLGNRKYVESQWQQPIPENLQSCPFVMSVLTKAGLRSPSPEPPPVSLKNPQPQQMR